MGKMLDAVAEIEVQALVAFLDKRLQYQSRISRIMRTVSEFLHFGRYYPSTKGKRLNQYISKGAFSLIERGNDTFCGETILEHPNPLERIYSNLLVQPTPINDDAVVKALGEYRLITVTSEENSTLKHKGWKNPLERYQGAGIEIGFVESIVFGDKPDWKPPDWILLPLATALSANQTVNRDGT